MITYNKATKEKFDLFIKNYPNKLEYDITSFFDPPVGSYRDFTNGLLWPDSIVAQVKLGETPEYYIKYNSSN